MQTKTPYGPEHHTHSKINVLQFPSHMPLEDVLELMQRQYFTRPNQETDLQRFFPIYERDDFSSQKDIPTTGEYRLITLPGQTKPHIGDPNLLEFLAAMADRELLFDEPHPVIQATLEEMQRRFNPPLPPVDFELDSAEAIFGDISDSAKDLQHKNREEEVSNLRRRWNYEDQNDAEFDGEYYAELNAEEEHVREEYAETYQKTPVREEPLKAYRHQKFVENEDFESDGYIPATETIDADPYTEFRNIILRFLLDPQLTLKEYLEDGPLHYPELRPQIEWLFEGKDHILAQFRKHHLHGSHPPRVGYRMRNEAYNLEELLYCQESALLPQESFEQLVVLAHPQLEDYLNVLAYHIKNKGLLMIYNPENIPLPFPILGEDLFKRMKLISDNPN